MMTRVLPLGMRSNDLSFLFSLVKRLPNPELINVAGYSTKAPAPTPAKELKRFPVQSLNVTLNKFLETAKPFLNENEFNNTKSIVDNFQGHAGLGPKLQKLLEKRANETENWFEKYWLNIAYLGYRDPVPIFSSPGLVWPHFNFSSVEEQLIFATGVISGALIFNSILNQRNVPVEKIGKDLADMQQYYKIFGTTRLPRPGLDEMSYQDPENLSKTIIVMHNNHIFNVQVYEESNGQLVPLNETQIFGQLKDIVAKSSEEAPPIGVLTSNNRDQWAKAYQHLSDNMENSTSLDAIRKALFIVCIDKPLPSINPPNEKTRTAALTLHGCGGSKGVAGNRWFDKTIQFIIGAGSDGVGVTYEHSPAEGGPIGVLTDQIVNKIAKSSVKINPPVTYPKPEELKFVVDQKLKGYIDDAVSNIDNLAKNLDLWAFTFEGFGKNKLKLLRVSPDSFIQIAIQYAYYKTHSKPAAQYESGSLRKFLHGRTDVIRTCSVEAVNFCKAACDPSVDSKGKFNALIAAINGHRNYTMSVVDGQGIDRHLTGLKLIGADNKMETSKLFSDPGYTRSNYFHLSTSNVPSICDGVMVYGPLVKDGYACCYNPRNDTINFGTSAWRDCETTGLKTFKESLEKALNEMATILTENTPPKSKL